MENKILRFHDKPVLEDLVDLKINGAEFRNGKGFIQDDIIIMEIPDTFRFSTKLEVLETNVGNHDLCLTQILTRWSEFWEMGEAFERIGFRNPEIESQLRELCDYLIELGLVYWTDESEPND